MKTDAQPGDHAGDIGRDEDQVLEQRFDGSDALDHATDGIEDEGERHDQHDGGQQPEPPRAARHGIDDKRRRNVTPPCYVARRQGLFLTSCGVTSDGE